MKNKVSCHCVLMMDLMVAVLT